MGGKTFLLNSRMHERSSCHETACAWRAERTDACPICPPERQANRLLRQRAGLSTPSAGWQASPRPKDPDRLSVKLPGIPVHVGYSTVTGCPQLTLRYSVICCSGAWGRATVRSDWSDGHENWCPVGGSQPEQWETGR